MSSGNNAKLRGFLLFLLGVGMAIIAQFLLLTSTGDLAEYFVVKDWWENALINASPIPGILLYIVAGILVVFGLRSLGDTFIQPPDILREVPARKPRFGFWVTSLGLAIVIFFHAMFADETDPYGYFYLGAWVLSILLLTASVLIDQSWRPPLLNDILTWIKAHRTELFMLAFVLAAAFLVRFLDLDFHPYSFVNDEGQMGVMAQCTLTGKCTNFFNLGWAEQPRLAFMPYVLSVLLLGHTAIAVRLVSVISGTLSVLAVYLFAREAFDKKIAWLSAAFLSTLPLHVHFSRTAVDNIADSLTSTLVIWLLYRGVKRSSTFCFLAAGVVSGLCIYTYPGSYLAPALGIFLLGWMGLQTRGFFHSHARNIVIFIFAAVVVALPIMGHYAVHQNLFMSRMKSEGLFAKDNLKGMMDATQSSAGEVLLQQFAKSSLVYIAVGAPVNFYNSPDPYLIPIAAIAFMLGLAYCVWRIRDPRFPIMLVWFWSVVIFGSTLTGGPPSSQRLLMSLPAAVIIVAIGVTKTIGGFELFYKPMARLAPIALLGFILYAGYANTSFYFGEYRTGHYYEDPTNEFTYETHLLISPLHSQGRMYLLSNPNIPYLEFMSFDYFSPDVEKDYLRGVTPESITALPQDKDVLFVALPDYKTQLILLRQWIPGGEWTEFHRRYQTQDILFYSYQITKEELAAFRP